MEDLTTLDNRSLLEAYKQAVLSYDQAWKRWTRGNEKGLNATKMTAIHKRMVDSEQAQKALETELLDRITDSNLSYIESLADSAILTQEQSENLKTIFLHIRNREDNRIYPVIGEYPRDLDPSLYPSKLVPSAVETVG